MAAANPLPPSADLAHAARVIDDPDAVKDLARRAERLAAEGVRDEAFLRAFGLTDDGPSVTITTTEELETFRSA